MTESLVKTVKIESEPPDMISYKPSGTAMCRIGGERFIAELHIQYKPNKSASKKNEWEVLEFVSFEKFLETLFEINTTIEEYARLVFCELVRALGDIPISVLVDARTSVHAPVSALITQGDWNDE